MRLLGLVREVEVKKRHVPIILRNNCQFDWIFRTEFQTNKTIRRKSEKSITHEWDIRELRQGLDLLN